MQVIQNVSPERLDKAYRFEVIPGPLMPLEASISLPFSVSHAATCWRKFG